MYEIDIQIAEVSAMIGIVKGLLEAIKVAHDSDFYGNMIEQTIEELEQYNNFFGIIILKDISINKKLEKYHINLTIKLEDLNNLKSSYYQDMEKIEKWVQNNTFHKSQNFDYITDNNQQIFEALFWDLDLILNPNMYVKEVEKILDGKSI